jgi:hypothetical protein
MPGNLLQSASNYVVISGAKGIYLHSKEGGFHLNQPGDDSFFIVDTKNLACIRTQKGFINIVDDGSKGLIDIQADDLVNLAVLDSINTQFTGLNIVNGKTHIGVFGTGSYDRLHAESKKIKLESSVGIPNAAAELGLVEVTPSKVTIKCMESIMEVDANGFSLQNAAKSFKMVLETSRFCVQDATGNNKFEINLATGTVSLKGLKLDLESTIETKIQNLESLLTAKIDGVESEGVKIKNDADLLISHNTTLITQNTDAISKLAARVTSLECWVARAVFGEEDYRWQLFRHWLFGNDFHPDRATWLQAAYLRHGPWFAEEVRRHPWLRRLLLPVMERCIRRLRGVPHPAFGRAALSLPVNLNIQPFTR